MSDPVISDGTRIMVYTLSTDWWVREREVDQWKVALAKAEARAVKLEKSLDAANAELEAQGL